MRRSRNFEWLVLGTATTLATACTGVRFPNSGWEDGRRTCENDCPGRLEQVRRFGGPAADAGRAIGLLSGGALLLTGTVTAPATWSSPSGDAPFCEGIERDVFLARYGSDGAFLGAVQAGGRGFDAAFAVGVDEDGGVVLAGSFEETAIFGADEPMETALTASGDKDLFLARYDPEGRLAWATMAGGPTYDAVRNLAVTSGGDIVVTGSYGSSAVFGAGEHGEASVESINDPQFSQEPSMVSDAFLGWFGR